jgi:hypothetical protein
VLKSKNVAVGALALVAAIGAGTVAGFAQPVPSKASDIRVSPLGGTPAQNGDTACVERALAAPFRPEHYIGSRVEFHGSGLLDGATYNCAAKQSNEMLRIRAKPTREGREAVAVAAASVAGMFGGDASQVAAAMRKCASQSVGEEGESWKWVNAGDVAVSCAFRNDLFVGRVSSGEGKPRSDAAMVSRCVALGAAIAKATRTTAKDVHETAYLGTTYTFAGRCTAIAFDCDTQQRAKSDTVGGHVSFSCDASTSRFVEALRAIAPSVTVGKIRPFAAACIEAAKAGKSEGPTDIEVGKHLLVCDPQHPDGVTVRVERM